ncbi:MAG TPA: TraU family protein [Noviherbaspirillum sp.]
MTRRVLRRLMAIAMAASFCSGAAAGTTTAEIFTNTAKGLPQCLNYRVTGACFWLKCVYIKCSVRTSLKISHFVPDAVVSVYHDPLMHPWTDYGRPVAKAVSGFGQAILGMPIDSAGTRFRDDRTAHNHLFRDADAIGHPLSTITSMLSGGSVSTDGPSMVAVPTPAEMMTFPSTIGSIMSEWASVPATVGSTVVNNAKGMADLSNTASKVTSVIGSVPGMLSNAVSAGQSLGNLMSSGLNLSNVFGSNSGTGGASGNGQGGNTVNLSSAIGNMSSFSGMGFFCPPASKPFGLYFLSHLDALTWRGVLPVEMLYPGSWIPGIREIGSFPLNTWSGVFPRDGNVTQQHLVKGPAVIAQRVGDIITRHSQPHIYTALIVTGEANGYRYFHDPAVRENNPGNTMWQRLYPNPESSCSAFGANDSLNITSWGDGNTSSEEGYVWNMWRRYECCSKEGQIFLGSV